MKQWKCSLILGLCLLVILILGIINISNIVDPNIGGRGQSISAILLVLYNKFGGKAVLYVLMFLIIYLFILSYVEKKKNK